MFKYKNKEELNIWKIPFFSMISAQALSMIGSSSVEFALIWWLTTDSKSPIILSIAGLFSFLPQALLGPFAGVWIDRFSRKLIMILTDMTVGILTSCLALSFLFAGNTPYWAVFTVLSIHSIATAFHNPSVQATIPLLVPKDEIVKANSYNELLQTFSYLLAPTIGAALFSLFPMYIILFTDLIGAIIACLIIAVIKIPELFSEKKEAPNFFRELKEGAKYYKDDKSLLSYTFVLFIAMVLYMPLGMLFPLVISNVFHGGPWFSGASQTFYTIGMMFAALVTSFVGKKLKNKLTFSKMGLLVFSISLLISGCMPANKIGLYIFIGLCLFMGMGVNLSNIPYTSYLQENIHKDVQGRALSIFNAINSIAMPIGLVIAGPLSNLLGLSTWFSVSGFIMLLVITISSAIRK